MSSRCNIAALQQKCDAGEKLVMVTAYDYAQAYLADQAGVDMILVGDSLGPNVLGYPTTLPVTLDEILYHLRPVVRGSQRALIVADMPFGCYQISEEQAVANAVRLIENGAGAIKLEGGRDLIPLIQHMSKRGIPVMAHIGLTPQTAALWQGQTVFGRDEESAWELVDTAQNMEEAGAFAIFTECVAAEAAALITGKVDIPVIGIGSGAACDGQAMVLHDLLGFTENPPLYVRRFADAAGCIRQGLSDFCAAVRSGTFPATENSFKMEEDEAQRLY